MSVLSAQASVATSVILTTSVTHLCLAEHATHASVTTTLILTCLEVVMLLLESASGVCTTRRDTTANSVNLGSLAMLQDRTVKV